MRFRITALLIFGLSSLVCAQTPKRPISHNDVWSMRRLGAPVISPDGKWVVVGVEEPAYDDRNAHRDLWLVSTLDESPPRRITASRTAQWGVEWSPDGQKIAFSTQREDDERPQIYVLNLTAGGEAERMTQLAAGARSPHWSPEGTRLLFTSDVYSKSGDKPAARPEPVPKNRPPLVRTYESFPVRYWNHWLDERHAHLFVAEATEGAKARDLLAGTQFDKNPGFRGELGGGGEELPAAWAPDGGSVLFVSGVNADALAYSKVNTDLFQVSAAGGEPVRLTTDPDTYGRPVFSPDGKSFLVNVTLGDNTYVFNQRRLARYPWPFDAGQRVLLLSGFDRAPSDPIISNDNRRVYFTADDSGLGKLYSIPLEGGEIRVDFEPPSGVVSGLSAGGSGENFNLVGLWGSAVKPAEVFLFDLGSEPRRLTQFNLERVAPLDLFPVEHIWIKTKHGQNIHSLIVRPPGFDPGKKYPVLAVVHGGPDQMARDSFDLRLNAHLFASPGYVVVLTNYRGSTGFGEEFARQIQNDPIKGPAEDVDDVLTEVVHRYAFTDGNRLAVVGESYGGHIVNWLQATTTRYRCFVAQSGMVNPEMQWATSDHIYDREMTFGGPVWEQGDAWRDQSAVRLAGNHASGSGWVTPILLSVGEKDFRVPINNTLENWTYLQRLKVPSRLLVFPDEGHLIEQGEDNRYWFEEVQAWLTRWFATED